MRYTFGEDPRIDDLAARLAALPRDEAVELAMRATSLDDLERTLPEIPVDDAGIAPAE